MFRTETPLLYEAPTEVIPKTTLEPAEPEGFGFDWSALLLLLLIGAVILWFTLE